MGFQKSTPQNQNHHEKPFFQNCSRNVPGTPCGCGVVSCLRKHTFFLDCYSSSLHRGCPMLLEYFCDTDSKVILKETRSTDIRHLALFDASTLRQRTKRPLCVSPFLWTVRRRLPQYMPNAEYCSELSVPRSLTDVFMDYR